MKITLFVQRSQDPTETTFYIVDAVDEWTVDSNPECITDILKEHADEDVRTIHVEVPDDTLERPWWELTLKGVVR